MRKIITTALAALAMASGTQAADFFSTEQSERLVTFGARLGVNTSNRTIANNSFPGFYNHESWGTGFDIGAVVNLNFRDYISLQPGFFFESRSSRYTMIGPLVNIGYDGAGEAALAGKNNTYNFTIPVMAIVKFNITDDIRWNVEAGPYVSFLLDSKLKDQRVIGINEPFFMQDAASVDFGFKLGTGFQFLKHYYIAAHYMAGCIDAWKERSLANSQKQSFGGLTKGWIFSLGYDF